MHTKEQKLEAFSRLLDIMDRLRADCPWNAAQTMESIRPMTEEEVYELSDAVMRGDNKEIAKEIGDLMYHLLFYAKMGEEQGSFDIADSMEAECEKMIFRHPHVFAEEKPMTVEEIARTWELVKAKEKDGNKTIMSGIPASMPALLQALSMQEKAKGCGFDWEKPEDVWDKLWEEFGEAKEACEERDKKHMEEEFGDLLFAVINAARLYGVDPEKALAGCCTKFRSRFNYMEAQLKATGKDFGSMSLDGLEELWKEAKERERTKKI